jgi:hypothetical protein
VDDRAGFSLGNALLLAVRIRAEEAALGRPYAAAFDDRPRFLPEGGRELADRGARRAPPHRHAASWSTRAPSSRATRLTGDLQLDSMAMIVVAVGLENRFRVRLDEEDAGALAPSATWSRSCAAASPRQRASPGGVSPLARLVGPPLPRALAPTQRGAGARPSTGASGSLVDAREQESLCALRRAAPRGAAGGGGAAGARRRAGRPRGLVLPTGRDFLDAFFGAQLAGAVPVPLYPPVRLGRMDEYVLHRAHAQRGGAVAVVLTDRRVSLLLGRPSSARARPWAAPPSPSCATPRGPEVEPAAPDALGVIQFSSGSTVDPKPVALSHHNLLAQCASLKALIADPAGEPPSASRGCRSTTTWASSAACSRR